VDYRRIDITGDPDIKVDLEKTNPIFLLSPIYLILMKNCFAILEITMRGKQLLKKHISM